MKNILTIIAITISASLFAQGGHGLKGPKAKNHRAWESTKTAEPAVTTVEEEKQGPEQKNAKVWLTENLAVVEVEASDKNSFDGPKAKNYKPWDNSKKQENGEELFVAK